MSEFFTNGMGTVEMLEAAKRGDLPGSLKVIGQLQTAIALIQAEMCTHPVMREVEAEVIRLIRDSQEVVRKAHETEWAKAGAR